MNKKQQMAILISIAVITLIIVGAILLNAYSEKETNSQVQNENQTSAIDLKTQQQLQEMDELRKQQGVSAPTQEEVEKQIKELDNIREKSDIKQDVQTEEEINEELKEL